ncbi:hypothetical protein J6590_060567 [Homalodisca vitripennis]|nr:hypothetical protein J6590_060567 [Homalodisca vitripennis]
MRMYHVTSYLEIDLTVNEATRVTERSKTCIDHVYSRVASKNRLEVVASVIDVRLTDHGMIAVTVRVLGETVCRSPTIRAGPAVTAAARPTYRVDYDRLGRHLETVD